MDFNFTDEQTDMLRDSVQRYLADTYTFDARMAGRQRRHRLEPGPSGKPSPRNSASSARRSPKIMAASAAGESRT